MNPPPYFTQTEDSVSITLLGTVSLRSNLSLSCDVQERRKVQLILTDAGVTKPEIHATCTKNTDGVMTIVPDEKIEDHRSHLPGSLVTRLFSLSGFCAGH